VAGGGAGLGGEGERSFAFRANVGRREVAGFFTGSLRCAARVVLMIRSARLPRFAFRRRLGRCMGLEFQ
jgi:hypothetical protein